MGTPDFAVPSLEKIHKEYHVLSVYTQPPKKSGRGLRTKLNPIHEISNDYNLPVKTPQNFKSFDIIEEIKNLKLILQEYLVTEEYEKAAVINQRINYLQKKL